ncbi:MAG: PIN domain-containing protein [Verrucomicrobiaceae bacterium]
MERNVLVDSSWFIDRLRRRIDPFRELEKSNIGYEFFSCGVVMTEVCRGERLQWRYESMRSAFAVMCWVPTSEKIWSEVTDLARNLAARGITMQISDLVIAVSALSADAAVLTLDSDFRQIPELQVIDKLEE